MNADSPETPPVHAQSRDEARKAATVSGGPEGLKRHDDIFFAAVQTTRMPMIVTDPHQPDNPIVFANGAFQGMTGYALDEIIGRNCRFLQGPETDRGIVDQIRSAIAQRQEFATEILNYRKNGSSFWNALFISPVYDREGNLIYFFASQLDVSRRRDAEDALRQSQKMEALGQLTGGIAHDFNNLLQVVTGYADVLKRGLNDEGSPRLLRAVDNIASAARRGATLTQQLLAFARKQRLEGRNLNLNTLVENLQDMTTRTLGEHINVVLKLSPDLANCRLDPVQAELAILNLLINARDAMPQGGRLTIATENRVVEDGDAALFGNVPPGDYVCLSITDTGTGMSQDLLDRVMEPFFTTKEEGKGTGLGLSMVYGFVKQSGGSVRLYSEPGHGTTVKLFVPSTDQRVDGLPAERTHGLERTGGSETILVVEDRADVAELATMMLSELGYNVINASNGRHALSLVDGRDDIDLIFSDMIMPAGMNGVVLAREARKRRPGMKVLLTTGYAEASIERRDIGGEEFDVISKPYTRMELAKKIRLVLIGPTGVG